MRNRIPSSLQKAKLEVEPMNGCARENAVARLRSLAKGSKRLAEHCDVLVKIADSIKEKDKAQDYEKALYALRVGQDVNPYHVYD